MSARNSETLTKFKPLNDHFIKEQQAEANMNKRKLVTVSIVCFIFMGLEIAGGIYANSVAI